MKLHVHDDGDNDVERSERKSDSCIKSPWLPNIHGAYENTGRFLAGDNVLVRCNQSTWFRGRITRHAKNGIRVWLILSETLVSVPSELVTSHLVRLQDHSSGANESHFLQIQCVRPSHLSHRCLYERVDIVPCRQYFEEAVKGCPDSTKRMVFYASKELMSCFNKDTFYPTKPKSADTDFSSQGFDPTLLREANPACCGILKDWADVVEKKLYHDRFQAERVSSSIQESEENYISAYDEAQDPNDEKSMDQVRAELYKKFMARHTTFLETSTHPGDDEKPLSSDSVDTRASGLSLEVARFYLASNQKTPLFTKQRSIGKQPLACTSAECSNYSDSCNNNDPSQHVSTETEPLAGTSYDPSKLGKHSGLYTMVEFGSRSQSEASSQERDNDGIRFKPNLDLIPHGHRASAKTKILHLS